MRHNRHAPADSIRIWFLVTSHVLPMWTRGTYRPSDLLLMSTHEPLQALTQAVWRFAGNDGECPPDKYPSFQELDDLITTTAWGCEAREEFAFRWNIVERSTDAKFEVGNFAELVHLVWEAAAEQVQDIKHPLAPLIAAWQAGPLEVHAVRDQAGALRGDTIVPRVAMREGGSAKTDKLYLLPAHISTEAEGDQARDVWLRKWATVRPDPRAPGQPV